MKTYAKLALLGGVLALAAGPVAAVDYFLCAGATTKALPDGSAVPIWGFAQDDDGDLSNGCGTPVSVPGPRLTVPAGDGVLNVTLLNELPEPTSVVVTGLGMPVSTGTGPTWNDGTTGARGTDMTKRVRSFGIEAGANGGIESYAFNVDRPGSYVYHSGTHPQKQVYMGLFGAATQNAVEADATAGTPAEAYDGVPYDNEVVLFYSDIDPELNASINELYNPTGLVAPYSTSIHYHPTWFLINGEPYEEGVEDIVAGAAGQNTLLRFFSAAGETHVPVLQGLRMTIHAEDGLQYTWQDGATVVATAPRAQYSAMLPPLKTKDAIIQPLADGRYAVYDGNGYMTNPSDINDFTVGDTVGGMLRFLSIAPNGLPVAADDSYAMDQDTELTVPAPGVLENDTDPDGDQLTAILDTDPANGTLTLNPDGSFTYTPTAGFVGIDSFTYVANDGLADSNIATVTITVNSAIINTPPVAVDDAYATDQDVQLVVDAPGVLTNDTDAENNPLTAVLDTDVTSGTLLLVADGSFTYTPNAGFFGTDSFTYFANDGTANSDLPATVTISVNEVVTTQLTVTVDDVPESHDILTYGGAQDVNATTEILDGGATFRIVGNGWKQIQLNTPYTVTADTVLEVTFSSTAEGEIHGIGLDVDDTISAATTFQFFGTQTWGIQTFNDYASGTVTYTIPVGTSFTGSFDRIIFAMDHDVATPTGEGVFSNISLSTAPPAQLNVTVDGVATALDVVTYGGSQDGVSITEVLDGGATLSIVGNGWKQVLFNCTVGAGTTLSFDFESGAQGEIHGIGFDTNDTISAGTTFQLYGTQNWGIQGFRTYTDGAGVVSYSIPVGDSFTGDFTRLIFVMDHDVASPTGESVFSDIVLTNCQ